MGSAGASNDDERFHTTQWSRVVAANWDDSPQSRAALAALCETYWPPLYAFVRRSGYSPADAEDLTQAFFARLLERNSLRAADRQRGRFRSFLLGAIKHFLANQRKATRAQKRGGGRQLRTLDFALVEAAYAMEPSNGQTPQRLFDRHWALMLLTQGWRRLEEEQRQAGKAEQFACLQSFLVGGDEQSTYRIAAHQLETTEAAVKMAVHRLRKRYREVLRDEIGQTVADPGEIDDEIRQLFAVLGPAVG